MIPTPILVQSRATTTSTDLQKAVLTTSGRDLSVYIQLYGSFRKLGVPYFGVLIIRIPLFRVLY